MKKIKLYESDSAEVEAQRFWVFAVLMGVGGFFGAFTYSIRGGVFCNAQTANFVLFAMALGRAQWGHALYFLIPMSAYFLGAVLSEAASSTMEQLGWMRWDTLLILVEMVAVVFLGLLPESTPFAITQVVINFICSMQYNTFRKTQGIPMATTFCTNHVRQMGIFFAKAVQHRNWDHVGRLLCHLNMLMLFVLGGVIATVLCRLFLGRALLFTLIPLGILFVDLLRADRKTAQN